MIVAMVVLGGMGTSLGRDRRRVLLAALPEVLRYVAGRCRKADRRPRSTPPSCASCCSPWR